MYATQLGRVEDASLWTRRDQTLQYTLTVPQTQDAITYSYLGQAPLPSVEGGVFYHNFQHPVQLPTTPLASPVLEREQKHSSGYAFGTPSFDCNIAASNTRLLSNPDISGDYFAFLGNTPPRDLNDDEPTTVSVGYQPDSSATQSYPPSTLKWENSSATSPEGAAGSPPSKKSHNEVERCYRNRLNDKIEELSSHLFVTDSLEYRKKTGRSRPSKCLVITRAKQRLEELNVQNTGLESEVEKLKKQVAVLEHLLVESGRERDIMPGAFLNNF